MRMGATHFLCKTLPKVATEMALNVLSYNLTRVLNIIGVKALIEASSEETNYGVRQLARQQLRKIDLEAAEAAGIK